MFLDCYITDGWWEEEDKDWLRGFFFIFFNNKIYVSGGEFVALVVFFPYDAYKLSSCVVEKIHSSSSLSPSSGSRIQVKN